MLRLLKNIGGEKMIANVLFDGVGLIGGADLGFAV